MAAALKVATAEDVVVLTGDTLFDSALGDLLTHHQISGAETLLALKHLDNLDRYGAVALSDEGVITHFAEKKPGVKGLINGGVYVINREEFLSRNLPEAFSFEKDYLEAFLAEGAFKGHVQTGYFIDIGVPADYERAQTEIPALLGVFGSGLEQ
jgi:D-glycero-alpha-D-manno-heptose 1-phosphate guanylyltransferase